MRWAHEVVPSNSDQEKSWPRGYGLGGSPVRRPGTVLISPSFLQSKVLMVTVLCPLKMAQVLSACFFPPLSLFLCFHLYPWRLVASRQVQGVSP